MGHDRRTTSILTFSTFFARRAPYTLSPHRDSYYLQCSKQTKRQEQKIENICFQVGCTGFNSSIGVIPFPDVHQPVGVRHATLTLKI